MNEYVTVNGRLYPVRPRPGQRGVSVKLTVGRDFTTGKQIQHDYTGMNAAEVQKKIDASLYFREEQLMLCPDDPILEDMFERYMKGKTLSISMRTERDMRGKYRVRIRPWFGKRSIRSICTEDIRNWQESLRAAGRKEIYISEAFLLMQMIMDFGVRKGYIQTNPCRYARTALSTRGDQSILNEAQLERLLIDAKEHPLFNFFVLTLLLGLRGAEARGLSWRQIDWKNNTVCICQQAGRYKDIIPRTKTGSTRTLKMPDSAVKILKRERSRQKHIAGKSADWSNPHNLVFTDEKGRMLGYNQISRAFQTIMGDSEENHVTIHSLRRTTASILAENVSMHAAQYYLGHAYAEVTLKYVYPSEKDQRHLADTVGEYYARLMKNLEKEGEKV